VNEPRAIAVDWSGRAGADQRKTIYLAEVARENDSLARLQRGRTRSEIIDLLIAEAEDDPDFIVGFDFAFSMPAWYLARLGITAVRELWSALASEALTPRMREVGLVEWMSAPEPPFWSSTKAASGLTPAQEFRRTEQELRRPGMQPKSVFQLVGAGQVGRGSLYGMHSLHRLSDAGFSIWPFDEPRLPLVLEVFPRVFSMGVNKSNPNERHRFLQTFGIEGPGPGSDDDNEDAFDAAVSASAIAGAIRSGELASLAREPEYAFEGRIWGLPKNALSRPRRAARGASRDELRTHVARVLAETDQRA
jgi:hypothetical protein